MGTKFGVLIAVLFLAGVNAKFTSAQSRENSPEAVKPITMPADRAADSYRIYSSLMPLGETAGQGWPHELWIIRDTTVAVVPPNESCDPGSKRQIMDMNPHTAVQPPEDRRQDFLEILQDFDRHCHDRIALDPKAWSSTTPVRLLNAEEQQRFMRSRGTREVQPDGVARPEPEFKGAPSLYAFSAVYFNAKHTVALVYATHFCGVLCGEGLWFALALEDGKWKQVRWKASAWIS
jgi:hypothetical protein